MFHGSVSLKHNGTRGTAQALVDGTSKGSLARDAFARTNRRAIGMMFVRLSVRPSVCLSGTGVRCDHTVHFSANLNLWLDSPMFWAP